MLHEKYKYVFQSLVVFSGLLDHNYALVFEYNILFYSRPRAATILNLTSFISFGWASPSLPRLLEPGGPVQITVEQGTWIVSCLKIGQFIAPIPAAWMMDRFGRKRTLLIMAVPLVSVWIMLALAESFVLICVFAVVIGSAGSLVTVVTPMYLAELCTLSWAKRAYSSCMPWDHFCRCK